MTRRINKTALVVGGVAALALLGAASFTFAQQAPAPGGPPGAAPGAPGAGRAGGAPGGRAGGGGGGGGGFSLNKPPIDLSDNTGWTQIFNGKDLTGWDGDKAFWSVKDNAIYAESTCEKPTGTVYIDWTGGTVSDFDLKFEFRGSQTANGGAQYRSWIVGTPGKPGAPAAPAGGAGRGGAGGAGGAAGAGRGGGAGGPGGGAPGAGGPGGGGAGRGGAAGGPGAAPGAAGGGRAAQPTNCPSGQPRGTAPDRTAQNKWYQYGPQYDFDNAANYPGQYYEQGTGRAIAGPPGQWTIAEPGQPVQQVAQITDLATVKTWLKKDDWNQALIVVRGHTYAHYLNGHLTAVFTDDDPAFYSASGMIGFEIESTGFMEMRNIYLRKH